MGGHLIILLRKILLDHKMCAKTDKCSIGHALPGVTATNITKTCLCNVYPLKPHFYIVKVGFTGVYIIFLISAQNIDCGYSLEPPRRGGSNEYRQSVFLSRNKKNIRFFI